MAKPRRLPNTRRALTPAELAEINAAARACGNDTVLDAVLLRLHTETACRRGGALALRLGDLDPRQCLLRLREKGNTLRWQPISPALAASLVDHAAARGSVLPTDQLLRYRDGRALTSRRYDHLWHRLGQELPWVAAQGISTHWLRHTTLPWVERHFGYGIARAYAGTTGPATTTYIKANFHEVATALAAMSHPRRPSPWTDTGSSVTSPKSCRHGCGATNWTVSHLADGADPARAATSWATTALLSARFLSRCWRSCATRTIPPTPSRYAVRAAGATDTIASMAGALPDARTGTGALPQS